MCKSCDSKVIGEPLIHMYFKLFIMVTREHFYKPEKQREIAFRLIVYILAFEVYN